MPQAFADRSSSDITFVIKNNSLQKRSIKVFNQSISPGSTFDLMKEPGITEEDIRTALTKSTIQNLFIGGEISVVNSTVNFITSDLTHSSFLISLGIIPQASSATSNVWLTQANWYIDPSNNTGKASDKNIGNVAAAPLLTWAEVIRRYGTPSPVLAQNTVFFFLSDQPGFSDPVYLSPIMLDAAVCGFQGSLIPVGTTGVLSGVIAKNRATSQLLNANLGTPVAPLVGFILENTIRGARCWIDAVGGTANVAVLTQPFPSVTTILPAQIPIGATAPAEVDTFANTDTYKVLRPVKINLLFFKPEDAFDSDPSINFYFGFIEQLWGLDPEPIGTSVCSISGQVTIMESRFDKFIQSQIAGVVSGILFNNWFTGTGIFNTFTLIGGAVNTALSFSVGLSKTTLDGDVIVHGLCEAGTSSAQPNYVGLAYVDDLFLIRYGNTLRITPNYYTSALWGPGTVEVSSGGRVVYDTSATSQLLTTNLKMDGTTNGNAFTRSSGTWAAQTSLTASHLDAADGKSLSNPQTGSCFAQLVE